MKRILLILTLGLLAAGVTAQNARAVGITGTIDMSGTAILNSTSLGSATAATGFIGTTVGGIPTGSFTGTGGSSVTWSAFSWPSNTAVTPLWTFTVGPTTYSFELGSVTVASQSNTFLNLLGTGVLSKTGFDDTVGSWSFTISNSSGAAHSNFAFTFANSQTAAVPEGGSALALLGMGLIGIATIGRKFRKA